MTAIAHADASLPHAAAPRAAKFETHWPEIMPCDHFSTLSIDADTDARLRWRGGAVDLAWTIPELGFEEPLVVPLRDYPARDLHTLEISGGEGFHLWLSCNDVHETDVSFECAGSSCTTGATYPTAVRPPIRASELYVAALRLQPRGRAKFFDLARRWVVTFVDAVCDQHCTPETRERVADLRSDDGWVVVNASHDKHGWLNVVRRGETTFSVGCSWLDHKPSGYLTCTLTGRNLTADLGYRVLFLRPRGALSLIGDRLGVYGSALRLH